MEIPKIAWQGPYSSANNIKIHSEYTFCFFDPRQTLVQWKYGDKYRIPMTVLIESTVEI